jgi:hypothetical protein
MTSLAFYTLLLLHPIHVSITEIKHDKSDKELEIVARIFLDDLEMSVRKQLGQSSLNLMAPQNGQTTEQLIQGYITKHLSISLDGKYYPVKYLGQELEGDALVCYMVVEHVTTLKTIHVTNSMLMEIHDDQSNLIHVTIGESTKSLRLQKNNVTDEITF